MTHNLIDLDKTFVGTELKNKLDEKLQQLYEQEQVSPENETLLSNQKLIHMEYCDKKNLTREDISCETNTEPRGKIELEELIESDCECVVITGTAKVGKTMLILKTIQSYLKSENFEYIFYCNFNQYSLVKPFEKINVFDFLTSNIKYFNWMNERHTCDEVLQEIIDGKKILLIMDNFECLDLHDSKHEEISYFNESTRENIIMNILRGFVFGSAKKIIISQPVKLEWMRMWPCVKRWRDAGCP